MRAYVHNENGEEVTTHFFQPGMVALSADSFNNQAPAGDQIVTKEDTELLVIPYKGNERALHADSGMATGVQECGRTEESLTVRMDEDLNFLGHSLRLYSCSISSESLGSDHEKVQGNALVPHQSEKAMEGCDAFHVTISVPDEARAMEAVVSASKKQGVKLISFVSGCTVSLESCWFPMIGQKYRVEQSLLK